MKKLFLAVLGAMVLGVLLGICVCHAQTYTPITKAGEVESINSVQVEESKATTEKRVLTIQFLDTQINKLTAEIASMTTQLNDLKALKTKVETEAGKVELKAVEKP